MTHDPNNNFKDLINDVHNDTNLPEPDSIQFVSSEKLNDVHNDTNLLESDILSIPNIIELDNSEKFKDENNNIIDIEIRGIRKIDSIFFKENDVSNKFNIDNLLSKLSNKEVYSEDIHYKYFNCQKNGKSQTKKNKQSTTKLYLTFQGMLKVLFDYDNSNIKLFIKWTIEILFNQINTIKQKEELICSVLGINAKIIKEVFNADKHTLPCVYLFTLNNVKELRNSMKIDNIYLDDSIVAKFGFTKDLSRRAGEHIIKYNTIENVNLKLKYYSYIDPHYMSSAEIDIKDFMLAFKTKFIFENEDELVIIPKELMKMVERQYEFIGKSYMGYISELIIKIKDLQDKNEKQELNHQLELIQERFEKQKLNHQLELSEKKYENLELNNKLELIKERYEKQELKHKLELSKEKS